MQDIIECISNIAAILMYHNTDPSIIAANKITNGLRASPLVVAEEFHAGLIGHRTKVLNKTLTSTDLCDVLGSDEYKDLFDDIYKYKNTVDAIYCELYKIMQ